ncbi:hypothetical protein [uncultured Enterococcus sp.]|uniref:hypothetical protein n=1 Tax=uncultured Enterococcus sp. TaxID=167972 RepID=UPI00260A88CF|nr:hypothetical protein [uncultured Enterococcus sp.]
MREYTYYKEYYIFDVLITGIISVLANLVSILLIFLNFYRPIMLLIAIVSLYSWWNIFIARVSPKKVVIDNKKVIFYSFGKTDEYDLENISKFQIREFPSAGKMYIRFNGGKLKKDRYWLNTKMYENGNELFKNLLDLEYEKHPETLKSRARRVNTEYLRLKKMEKSGKNV